MNYHFRRIESQLMSGLRAWRRSRIQRGIGIALLALLLVAGLLYFAMPAHNDAPVLWWSLLGVAIAAWLALTVQYLILPLYKRPSLERVARYIEEHNPDLEDRLVTAVEFGKSGRIAEDSRQLLDKLVRDAWDQTKTIDFDGQLQIHFARLWRALAFVAVIMTLVSVARFGALFQSRFSTYLTSPSAKPEAVTSLRVTPGDVRVPRGDNVEIIAESPELTISEATLFLSLSREAWSPNMMTTTTQLGRFSYQLTGIHDTTRYYVRAGDEISPIYTIIPLEAPAIRNVRLTYRYPQEIGLPAKTEEGSGDIYAPAGTEVEIAVTATQSLARADWRIGPATFRSMRLIADTVAQATLTVEKDNYYVVRLTNHEGLTNPAPEYYIHVAPDDPPHITIVRPGRDLRPTMLEEVPVHALVREDFGLTQLVLIYSLNNQPAVRRNLLPAATRKQQEGSTEAEYEVKYLFRLEALSTEPGDFVSYHFEAADAQNETSSDLYFFEVRPFEEEFYRALSQSGAGNASANGLAISQKEIITATWKLKQNRNALSRNELSTSSAAIAETQEGLLQSIVRMAENARVRGNFTNEADQGKMVQYLQQAAEAMKEAVPLLEQVKLAEALDPERRAYHHLLQADAEIRKRQLAQSSGMASSFGQLQSRDELARLFRDEMDKIRSKYETLQSSQQQQVESQFIEAQQKVRELAQRQERLVELNRQMARENGAPQDRRRQIERLRREQEQINRDIQKLNRQLQQLGEQSRPGSQSSQQLSENLRRTAQDMRRAADNLRRGQPANAAAEGNRALERLRRLEEELKRQQTESLRDQLARMREEFHELANSQTELSEQVKKLGEGASADQRQVLQDQQNELRQQSERSVEELRRARRLAEQHAQESRIDKELQRLIADLDRRDLTGHMQRAAQAVEENALNRAVKEQKDAAQTLRRAETALKQSLSHLSEAAGEKLDLARQEIQQLRQALEQSAQQSANRNQPAGEPAQSQGQQAGGAETSHAGGASPNESRSDEVLRPEEINWWNEQLWQGARQLENVRPFVQNDTSLANDYNNLLQGYHRFVRTFRGGDRQRLADIEGALIDPLRRFEAELATRLAVLQHRDRLLTIRDDRVPPQYREMVDKYFETLSKSKR